MLTISPNIILCLQRFILFINTIDKLSKKEREEKNKRKVQVVKAVEKAIDAYEHKFK